MVTEYDTLYKLVYFVLSILMILCYRWSQGYKGDTLLYIDPVTVCYACGNTVKFTDTVSLVERVFQSPGNGVSQIAVSSTHSVFAIAEMGLHPKVYVCQYPSMEVLAELNGESYLLN